MSLLTKELKKLGFSVALSFKRIYKIQGNIRLSLLRENGKLVIPSIPMIFTR